MTEASQKRVLRKARKIAWPQPRTRPLEPVITVGRTKPFRMCPSPGPGLGGHRLLSERPAGRSPRRVGCELGAARPPAPSSLGAVTLGPASQCEHQVASGRSSVKQQLTSSRTGVLRHGSSSQPWWGSEQSPWLRHLRPGTHRHGALAGIGSSSVQTRAL